MLVLQNPTIHKVQLSLSEATFKNLVLQQT